MKYSAKGNYVGEIAEHYIEKRKQDKKWRWENQIVEDFITANTKMGQTVLDVPVGTGRFLPIYRKAGLKVIGIDISGDMLKEARKLLDSHEEEIKLLQGDAEKLQLGDHSVDYAVCVRLATLLPRSVLAAAISEFARVTKYKILLQARVSDRRIFHVTTRFLKTAMKNPQILGRLVVSLKSAISKYFRRIFLPLGNDQIGDCEADKPAKLSEAELMMAFRKNRLAVQEVLTMDDSDAGLKWVTAPYRVYILGKES